MLTNEKLQEWLENNPDIHHVVVEGDGYHYRLTLVSDVFIGKSTIARQQWVYKLVKEFITSGSLHALTMQTFTKEEWEKKHG